MNDQLRQALVRSRELGFLGPGPVEDHVEHARGFLPALGGIPDGARLLDLGSGGGVPGLVLAIERPDLHLVLLDAMTRRCTFLDTARDELGLRDRVEVVCERAEIAARRPELRERFHAVTARSFAAPAVTAECAAAFVRVHGSVLVSEPAESRSEDRWPATGLAPLGLVPGDRWSTSGATIQELRSVESCPERFPRRVGVPAKRPLF